MAPRLLLALALLAAGAAFPAAAEEATLRFERDGALVREISKRALRAACEPRPVEVAADPYYGKPKRYLACPLARVLELGFGAAPAPGEDVFFRALDGYVKPASGARLAEPGGFVAFADADRMRGDDPGWEPIDRREVDPDPFYVVWTGAAQNDPHVHPWPYQLAAIEIADFGARFPHTRPTVAPEGSAAWRGFAIFRRECVACHAVNGEGGRVGPELNVPRSIVEYRPKAQLVAFIRDPSSFRYTTMPANRHLSDADLDALLAYFEAMSRAKHDPGPPAP